MYFFQKAIGIGKTLKTKDKTLNTDKIILINLVLVFSVSRKLYLLTPEEYSILVSQIQNNFKRMLQRQIRKYLIIVSNN